MVGECELFSEYWLSLLCRDQPHIALEFLERSLLATSIEAPESHLLGRKRPVGRGGILTILAHETGQGSNVVVGLLVAPDAHPLGIAPHYSEVL